MTIKTFVQTDQHIPRHQLRTVCLYHYFLTASSNNYRDLTSHKVEWYISSQSHQNGQNPIEVIVTFWVATWTHQLSNLIVNFSLGVEFSAERHFALYLFVCLSQYVNILLDPFYLNDTWHITFFRSILYEIIDIIQGITIKNVY